MPEYPIAKLAEAATIAFHKAVEEMGAKVEIPMETPPENMGDFGFACHMLAKEFKRSPVDIAKDVAEKVFVEEMEVKPVGPYVNFFIHAEDLVKGTLELVSSMGEDYGKGEKSEKIILEHTSANPNGPFHVGRARNPIIGDTLARMLRFSGYDVEVQYWVNDMGKQVAILTWGCRSIQGDDLPVVQMDKDDHDLVRYYQKANALMEEDPNVQEEIAGILKDYETAVANGEMDKVLLDKDGRTITVAHMKEYAGRVLEGMKASLKELGVEYDKFVWESESVQDQSVFEIIKKLDASEYSQPTDDGASFIDLEPFGIQGRNTNFIFKRSDGSSLYTTRDLAYHSKKLGEADICIDVLGEDHKLQAKQLSTILEILGLEKLPEAIFYAFVALPEGKMSTRRGRVVYLDDLIQEAKDLAYKEVDARREELTEEQKKVVAGQVGIAALRYNIIRVQNDKKITFKWEDALNFEGDSGPFAQYTYARASSIIEKAGGSTEGGDPALLTHASEHALVKMLARFPVIVEEAARERRAHAIAGFAHSLASSFNQFYRDCQVVGVEEDVSKARLRLVEAFRTVMRSTLWILGIPALESM